MPAVARPNPVSRRIARRVRELRLARRWSQKEFARHLSATGYAVGHQVISNWEHSAGVSLSADQILAIATAFGVTPNELFGIGRCRICDGKPPAGFTCSSCGSTADLTADFDEA